MMLQFLAHNRSSLILKTMTTAGNWCWSLSISSCRRFLWRRRRRWWRCDVLAKWMFFPLCFLAPSLFSCELLPRLIPMKENIAPLEEKKTGDRNEGMKAMARARWLVPLCFLLLMFFPSARPCCALLRLFVSMIFFPVLPLFLPLYFLSSSLSLFLYSPLCFSVRPSSHSRPSCIYCEEMAAAAMASACSR